MGPHRIFLLSPAFCGGRRSAILLRTGSDVPIAVRLQTGALTLGEAFSFLSGLYFRGKLTYARRFARARSDDVATLVITPSRGLMPADTIIDAALLREFAAAEVSENNVGYRRPLERDATRLAARIGTRTPVVLLGSIATGKYVDLLAPIFGNRLRYPPAFIGRGDMSRGGLLLRHAAAGHELDYEPLEHGIRPRGPRPPKLDPRDRVRA